ncbi:hypothetical protein KC947_01105 [Candidatus Saccharibacteria bacterium]|nr:hypothetical protein [Candidatus Saccharibacteria bacterium]
MIWYYYILIRVQYALSFKASAVDMASWAQFWVMPTECTDCHKDEYDHQRSYERFVRFQQKVVEFLYTQQAYPICKMCACAITSEHDDEPCNELLARASH